MSPRPAFSKRSWPYLLAVVVQVGTAAWIALPFWIALYRPAKTVQKKSEFRTRLELPVEALERVRTWFSGPITSLADGAYDNASLSPSKRTRLAAS